MAKEPRPKGYPKLKNYKPSQFMLPTSHYDKKKADRAVTFIENLCHTKGKWAGTPFWLLPWQEQLIRDIFGMAGLPAGVMGVYISINTLCDMGATCVNVIGDMAGCVVLKEKIKLED